MLLKNEQRRPKLPYGKSPMKKTLKITWMMPLHPGSIMVLLFFGAYHSSSRRLLVGWDGA